MTTKPRQRLRYVKKSSTYYMSESIEIGIGKLLFVTIDTMLNNWGNIFIIDLNSATTTLVYETEGYSLNKTKRMLRDWITKNESSGYIVNEFRKRKG
jgi:hypothetical protein